MTDSVGLYLSEIGTVPLLTAEEERQLSRRIEAGRHAAEAIADGSTDAADRRAVREAARAKDRF
ncbi:MAG: RNA polymerase subunit sigma, partial [Microthrixaceae bacterium]|nr:RNA polymerase subunit sigma [Microthrixaceae bacterium]